MYAHISFNNREFGKIYIDYMFKLIAQNDYQIVRRFERPILLLVQLHDEYQSERIKMVLNNLYEMAKKSTQFWKFCDALIDLTCKLTLRCHDFAVELSKNKQFIQMLQQITKENPSFPVGNAKAKIFKTGQIDWNLNNKPGGIRVAQHNVDEIKAYTRQRLDRMI